MDMKYNKALHTDNLQSELFKYDGSELKKKITHSDQVWEVEEMLSYWKKVLSVLLYKKGDKMVCRNHRRITLLNLVYKILSSVLYCRLSLYI